MPMQKRRLFILPLIVPSLVASTKPIGAPDHKVGISKRRRQNLDYIINRLTLIQSISSTFQLPISRLDEARISENCEGEEDGGHRAPASGTQFRCATQGRWLFRLVGSFITVFHPTVLNTSTLVT